MANRSRPEILRITVKHCIRILEFESNVFQVRSPSLEESAFAILLAMSQDGLSPTLHLSHQTIYAFSMLAIISGIRIPIADPAEITSTDGEHTVLDSPLPEISTYTRDISTVSSGFDEVPMSSRSQC